MFKKNLLNFTSLNETPFSQLMHDLGFALAATYRLEKGELSFVFGSEAPKNMQAWPANILFEYLNYTANDTKGLPLGWFKPKFAKAANVSFPPSTFAYFPDQDFSPTKLVLFVCPLRRRRLIEGQLNGEIEVIMRRMRHFIDSSEMRTFINEVAFDQHIRKLSIDLQTLIDHELRTPLCIMSGYVQLLNSQVNGKLEPVTEEKLIEFFKIMDKQANLALEATQNLGMTLRSSFENYTEKDIEYDIDLIKLIDEVVHDVKIAAAGNSANIVFARPKDKTQVTTRGITRLVKKAIYEVVYNAFTHCANNGNVRVTLYETAASVVIDIEDDGDGVPVGSEDLIFLRFFQGPNLNKAKRSHHGLGLGLYLARHIAEQHYGKLNFIRQGRNGLFRFLFPLAEEVRKYANTSNYRR